MEQRRDFFPKINLSIVLMNLLYSTEFPTEQLIRHIFLRGEFSKSNQT